MEVTLEGFKVIVHIGSICVKNNRNLTVHAQKIGAWGIGVMAPPFPKVNRIEELMKYYEKIACGVPELPFYFYHMPVFNGEFDMLHGQDKTILPCLAIGGVQGGIGGTTNYNGKELVGIIEAWKAGDLETSREKQNFSQGVIHMICHYRGNIVGGKHIMKRIGLDLEKNRTSFRNMTDAEETVMSAELGIINFFKRCNKF